MWCLNPGWDCRGLGREQTCLGGTQVAAGLVDMVHWMVEGVGQDIKAR